MPSLGMGTDGNSVCLSIRTIAPELMELSALIDLVLVYW